MKLQRDAADRASMESRHDQRAFRWRQFVGICRKADGPVESGVKALIEFAEILFEAPPRVIAIWLFNGKMHKRCL